MISDQQAAEILGQIEEQTKGLSEGTPSKDELCKKYKLTKPLIEAILPWIEKLPNGKKIADVIRFLMRIADLLCP